MAGRQKLLKRAEHSRIWGTGSSGFMGQDKCSWPPCLGTLIVQEVGFCLASLSPLRSLFRILLEGFWAAAFLPPPTLPSPLPSHPFGWRICRKKITTKNQPTDSRERETFYLQHREEARNDAPALPPKPACKPNTRVPRLASPQHNCSSRESACIWTQAALSTAD